MLRTPVFRDIEIAGVTVRVHKPRARQASIVAQRLMESFGETLLRAFTSPDEEFGDVFSNDAERRDVAQSKLMLAGGFMERAIKRLRELGEEIGPDHLAWYLDNTLAGNVSIDGYRYQSIEELDDAGFGFADLMLCMSRAIEIAIYPTSGDPDTDAGKSEHKSEPVKPPPTESASKARCEAKRSGATRKGGQSVPMSGSSG